MVLQVLKRVLLLVWQDEDGNGLTDEEIRAEVVTFFAAGQDTVAAGESLYTFAFTYRAQS